LNKHLSRRGKSLVVVRPPTAYNGLIDFDKPRTLRRSHKLDMKSTSATDMARHTFFHARLVRQMPGAWGLHDRASTVFPADLYHRERCTCKDLIASLGGLCQLHRSGYRSQCLPAGYHSFASLVYSLKVYKSRLPRQVCAKVLINMIGEFGRLSASKNQRPSFRSFLLMPFPPKCSVGQI
jgi:hypothetical protein